jgi:hypothetical protein
MRFIRFFLALILRISISRAFCAFFTSYSICLIIFLRVTFSRVAVQSVSFLIFFITISRAFFSRAIAYSSTFLLNLYLF